MPKKFKARARTRVEKVLDALRHTHPRYNEATPEEIAAALRAAGYKPRR
jgi:hypothetical protein